MNELKRKLLYPVYRSIITNYFPSQPIRLRLRNFIMYVRLNDWAVGSRIFIKRNYEPHVTSCICSLLKFGDVVVDIGANIGYLTLWSAVLVGRKGKVIAIEPNPVNCQLIRSSIDVNNFDNVCVLNYAASDQRQELTLRTDGSNGAIVQDDSNKKYLYRHVQSIDIDTLLQNESRIDLIKMDIEGYEPIALRGMKNIIHQHHPIIISELSPGLMRSVSDTDPEIFLDNLREEGYDIFICHKNGTIDQLPRKNQEIMLYWQELGDPAAHLDIIAKPHSYL